MFGRRGFSALITAGVVALLAATTAVPAQAVINPMPPLSHVTVISAAERQNILHLYNTTDKVNWTFDDCATQAHLTALLGFLSSHNVQAKFFFTGQCMLQHPTYRAQILNAKHFLGNHSYDHTSYVTLTASRIYTEVRRSGSVAPTTTPKLCRPPYGDGAFSVRVYNALAAAGCRPAYWTVDTRDWSGSSAAVIVSRVKYGDSNTPRLYAGGVILMHGTGLHTLEALPGIYNVMVSRGLRTFHLRR